MTRKLLIDEELDLQGLTPDAMPDRSKNELGKFPWDLWNQVVGSTIGLRWNYDNHARGISLGDVRLLPTPGNLDCLLVDRFVASRFSMDLVENTVNAVWSQDLDEKTFKLALSEKLLQSSVTSLQTIDGPWHPAIADLRSDSLLKSFRRRIDNVPTAANLVEVDSRLAELSREFERVTLSIVEQHFETSSLSNSAASFVVGFIPVVGNVVGAAGLAKEISDKLVARRDDGWVGFLGRAKRRLPAP